jgi:uncharacterized membrane protein
MQLLKLSIATMVTASVLDLAWMGVVAGAFYKSRLGALLRPSRDFSANHWVAIVLIYVAIAAGVIFFVLPRVSGFGEAALWGAAFGLILYGLYELTNYSLVVGWPFSVVVIDTLWGAVICGVVSMVAFYLNKGV